MSTHPLEIKASIGILKPAREVFEAIVDPAAMTHYFISESSGRMEAGAALIWKFPEFPDESPVRVDKVEPDSYISFYWEGLKGRDTLVEIRLKTHSDGATIVSVMEKGADNDEAGLAWLKGNTEGWANFLACLKAWTEYGINLRKGAFGYRAEEGGAA